MEYPPISTGLHHYIVLLFVNPQIYIDMIVATRHLTNSLNTTTINQPAIGATLMTENGKPKDDELPFRHVAVVIPCIKTSGSSSKPLPSLQQTLKACLLRFCPRQIFVLEYGATPENDDESSVSQSILLDEMDLHQVNYIYKETEDVRQAFKDICHIQLKKYKQVLVVDWQAVESVFHGSTLHYVMQASPSDVTTCRKRLFPMLWSSFSLAPAKRHQREPPNQPQYQMMDEPYMFLWRRTALLLLLRSELRSRPWLLLSRQPQQQGQQQVITPLNKDVPLCLLSQAVVSTTGQGAAAATSKPGHDVCRIPVRELLDDALV